MASTTHAPMRITRRTVALAAAAPLALGALTFVGTQTADANTGKCTYKGTDHCLIVKVSSKTARGGMWLCKDWTSSSRTAKSCPSKYGFLATGKKSNGSPLYWDDTDGAAMPGGYRIKRDQVGPDPIYGSNCTDSAPVKWQKLSPTPYGAHEYSLYLQRC